MPESRNRIQYQSSEETLQFVGHVEDLIHHGLVDVQSRLEKRIHGRPNPVEESDVLGDHKNAEGSHHGYVQRMSTPACGTVVHYRRPVWMAHAVRQNATFSRPRSHPAPFGATGSIGVTN